MNTNRPKTALEPRYYEGIDFANGVDRIGRCFLLDGEDSLTVAVDKPSQGVCVKAAIDCPLGTTIGFAKLLGGELPPEHTGGFKSRTTEQWLRDQVAAYQTTILWKNKNNRKKKTEREPRYKGVAYFNPTGHVQPTVEMCIVPECLWWLGRRLAPEGEPKDRLNAFIAARKGDGPVVEAHPRMFLYSLVERVYRTCPTEVNLEMLFAVVQYKNEPGLRKSLYGLIREQSTWMGKHRRNIQPVEMPDCLANSDHMFDAFLCALTAWARQDGECIDWQAARIPSASVEVEGHILVLRQLP